ncbi:MAG: diguanylate cyclase [Methylobacter sp.]|uniref:GGDEF domain-containing protein n=1 Tax=Methylobacter sp. TaxID=2051955 RepID=UPI0027207A03|nr:diguanylate cyclase [Methylobacter sp.]MDO9267863.1 diguanylate cyclase [Methylobacter sp.]MDP1667024.1 diguanylate cyclase [Methylobacter sp.]MDP1970644.1 diguanylate cyclase [Methylobacter sp.]
MNTIDTGRFGMEDISNAINLGLIVVDADSKVLLWNNWIAKHSDINETDALNRQLENVFSESVSPAFLTALKNTLTHRLPVVLSTALHRTPLPLYDSSEENQQQTRMYQSITITPIQSQLNESCCLIQVTDSSTSIKREKILRSHSEILKIEATTDSLTDICNRRFFDAHYEMAIAEAKRQKHPLSIFMVDIDFFKSYNDYYGHIAGDNAIKQVASALKSQLSRATDIVARYGGEEFVLVMPHLPQKVAEQFAEKLRSAVFNLAMPHIKSRPFNQITISVGLCTGIPENDDNLLNKADAALYQAKLKGRNQCICLPLCETGEYLEQ